MMVPERSGLRRCPKCRAIPVGRFWNPTHIKTGQRRKQRPASWSITAIFETGDTDPLRLNVVIGPAEKQVITMFDFEKFESPKGWHWRWGEWISPAFPYLEARPWTPLLIGGRLCFSASTNASHNLPDEEFVSDPEEKWCVVWGDEAGPMFKDVLDTTELDGRPLYIAVRSTATGYQYHIVWHDKISQGFDRQITFRVEEGRPLIYLFHSASGGAGTPIEPEWSNIDHIV
ncbi:hypothetical protein K1W69_19350 [Hoeflea sp. WL0058]|uniref:Uncharacterized protein n=1 Tax=Flavimaribacter sediminis TaxID=2865987 RepID=A0AAE2ZNR0_9HYPH|nr:hypothetical protein [Flavimaribacter sediminis]MBW8639359.1 hypothetical protein [Flavimaribacter sediminis]